MKIANQGGKLNLCLWRATGGVFVVQSITSFLMNIASPPMLPEVGFHKDACLLLPLGGTEVVCKLYLQKASRDLPLSAYPLILLCAS